MATVLAWEAKLARWSVGPGKTEEDKMNHAVTAIRGAIDVDPTLTRHEIEVLPTGSFKNRTQVPTESDVDVAAVYKDVFHSEWQFADPRAKTETAVVEALMLEAGVSKSPYTYAEYKNSVEAALVARFGRAAVKRGDKAFDVHENTYRIESDCLAALQYRQWTRNSAGKLVFAEGIAFTTDKGKDILNFPKQQFDNGEAKHNRTNRRYKKLVRILKNLRNEMDEAGNSATGPISSFLIECLLYQVPDVRFTKTAAFYLTLQLALAYLGTNLASDESCKTWTEVNEIKFLFHPNQPWTRAEALAFVLAAYAYMGY